MDTQNKYATVLTYLQFRWQYVHNKVYDNVCEERILVVIKARNFYPS